MNKKTSAVAIVIAVIMSIVLFLPIVISGLASGTIFSVQAVLQPGREDDLYRSFEDNGGIDYIYDVFLEETGEELEFTKGVSVNVKEFFPKKDVATIVKGLYYAFLEGETYSVKLDFQKTYLKEKAMEYFEQNAENLAKEELGELYELASESQKQETMDIARREYEAEVDSIIEEEVSTIEVELSDILNEVYKTTEYQEMMDNLDEFGYSLADRDVMCSDIGMAGNVFLVIGAILIVLLLLCHWFRPAGFVTAGVFSLLTGGIMKGGAVVIPSAMGTLLQAEKLEGESVPDFMIALVEDIMNWSMEGFQKVGMLALGLGAVLFLVGILLFVIKRNSAAV